MKISDQPLGTTNVGREVTRPCPVCGGQRAETIFRQSFQSAVRGGPINGYDVVVCAGCGTAFADGIPPQSEFDEYYRELSKYEYGYREGKESEDDSHRLQALAELLQSIIPSRDSRILEIGCANGRLLSYLKDAGYGFISGLDPSPGCSRAAKALYNVQVETGTVFDFRPERAYDVIVSLGVLEHIRDLKLAVEKIRHITSSGGRAFIGVPDASNLISAQDAPFQEFSVEHINFFSPISLRYVMEASGFRTVSCGSVSIELHRGILTPTICGVFEPSSDLRKEFRHDDSTKKGLIRYIDECEAMDSKLRTRIQEAVHGRTIVVWGVGTHTRRLLANGTLRPANISAFIDSNPKYQDQQLAGVPVLSPDRLTEHPEPILISSHAFQNEISEQIRERLRLPNELILLYNTNASGISND